MPKAASKGAKLVYPAGCKEVSGDMNKEELVKRLKALARAFQDMGQDDNEKYTELALHLASEFFIDHSSKDVRLLVACCIADVFRIFAPEAPYTNQDQLKEIFLFLIKQLRGLDDPEAPQFKRYFYLLENLAWVKSFNICIELEDNQEIFCSLFKLMFDIINDKHTAKVKNFMLDMMCPLIAEADSVSQKLLDIILVNIIEPWKSQNRQAYDLAKDLIKRTSNAIEPYIQTFFNNALMLGKTSESEVSDHIFKLIYELNMISPSILLAVLPQLEFKLKSNDEGERKAVTKLLARMFSDTDSDLAVQNKPLWLCFLGRFNDISASVRTICVQYSQQFLINHPALRGDMTENLKQRQHDQEENIRYDVVQSIIAAAKKDLPGINDELLGFVKERTLDKKFKVRREALLGLGHLFKKVMSKSEDTEENKELRKRVDWMKDRVINGYYQTNIEDRLVVERIFNTCLVPYMLDVKERMKRLYYLYATLDQSAIKALNELLKMQYSLRCHVRGLLDLHSRDLQTADSVSLMMSKVYFLSRNLPDSNKALEHVKKFNQILRDDKRIRTHLQDLVSPGCPCKMAEEHVKEILKKIGGQGQVPAAQQGIYGTVKVLLERIAPVLIDQEAISHLMTLVDEAIRGLGEMNDEIKSASLAGMKLLYTLSYVYPGAYQTEATFTHLIALLKHEDEGVSDLTLQIFCNTGYALQEKFPNIYSSLLPVLTSMVKIGSPKQAKHAVKGIAVLCSNKEVIYAQMMEHLKKSLNHESVNFLTALVAIGHIAFYCPQHVAGDLRSIVSKFIVKDLLMQDRSKPKSSSESWYGDHMVSEETQAKIHGMKLICRWLLGLKTNMNNLGQSTLRLLHTCIIHDGDLMERGNINKPETSRLRLAAGCCMLKLAQENVFAELITHEQFQALALLINDSCFEVRARFAQKLHKGLFSMKLPLRYMSIFSLAANDPFKERKQAVKQYISLNIQKRREYIKQHSAAANKLFSLLPEYVLPYTIHLLAHDPDLTTYKNVPALINIRECLWFVMEPLIKSENQSYNFFRKIFEMIKQTRDAQGPTNEEMNCKLYAVCDLGHGLLISKSTNFVFKDGPAKPVLPMKLFSQADENFHNTKIYLPDELLVTEANKKKPAIALSTTQDNKVQSPVVNKKAKTKAKGDSKASPVPNVKENKEPSKKGNAKKQTPSSKGGGKKGAKKKVEEDEKEVEEEEEDEDEEEEEDVEEKSQETGTRSRGRKAAVKSPVKSPVKSVKKMDNTKGNTSIKYKQTKLTDLKNKNLQNKGAPSPAKNLSPDKKTVRSPVRGRPAKTNANKSPNKTLKKTPIGAKLKRKVPASPASSSRSSRSSPRSEGPGIRSSRRGSPASSPSPVKRLRGAPASSPKPAKKIAINKNIRKVTKNLSPDFTVNSDGKVSSPSEVSSTRSSPRKAPSDSTRSSQRKRQADSSPVKGSPAKRSRNAKTDDDDNDIPSSGSTSASSPKKKLPKALASMPKKSYPMRGNVRRGARLPNGNTSDGEEQGTPSTDSTPSPRKRSAQLAKAIETAAVENGTRSPRGLRRTAAQKRKR